MVAVWLSLCVGTVLGLEVRHDPWNPVMQDSDYLAETSAASIDPADFLLREINVSTFPELDVTDEQYVGWALQQNQSSQSVAKFSGKTALPDAVRFLNHDKSFHMHPSISDAISLQQCQHDPECKWIWGTSHLLTGAEVKITGVIGKFNTSLAGTRCHVDSQENHVTCHRADPSLKLSRGEAYLLAAVPTVFPNQPPLQVAAMCHFKSATTIDSPSWDRWCHLISGKEFIVVPSEGFSKIGVHADDVEVLNLENRQTRLRLALGKKNRAAVAKLASGEQVSVAYPAGVCQ